MARSAGVVAIAAVVAAIIVWAAPSVFPTGTTIYDPGKAWNGYTVLSPLAGEASGNSRPGKVVPRSGTLEAAITRYRFPSFGGDPATARGTGVVT